MNHVVVTGATGFIGRWLVRDLLSAGYRVRALVRSRDKARDLEALGAELVHGDVTEPPSVDAALDGVDGVLHLAAVYAFGVDEAAMRAVNVEGTRCVLDAAARRGIRRVLYCGSDTSLGPTHGAVRDETHRERRPARSSYERTKSEAHDLVEARIAQGAPIVHAIVSTVYGPGDASPIGDLIDDYLRGRMPFVLDPDAGYTFAHVEDVAHGLRLAYEKGALGRSYLISGEPASFGAFFRAMSRESGRPVPPAVPRRLLGAMRAAIPVLGLAMGKRPAQARELFAMGTGVTRYFSNERARTELGWEARPLAVGLAQTLAPAIAARRAEARGGVRASLLQLGASARRELASRAK